MLQGLSAGHSFVLMHYNEAVGYISPEVTEKVRRKVGGDREARFPELK